jgi:hypothetical protein
MVAIILALDYALIVVIGRHVASPGAWQYWLGGFFALYTAILIVQPKWVMRWLKREEEEFKNWHSDPRKFS